MSCTAGCKNSQLTFVDASDALYSVVMLSAAAAGVSAASVAVAVASANNKLTSKLATHVTFSVCQPWREGRI